MSAGKGLDISVEILGDVLRGVVAAVEQPDTARSVQDDEGGQARKSQGAPGSMLVSVEAERCAPSLGTVIVKLSIIGNDSVSSK